MDDPQQNSATESEREERIRERAYELWIQRGQPEGQDIQHWMEAERDIGSGYNKELDTLEESLSVLGNPTASAQ